MDIWVKDRARQVRFNRNSREKTRKHKTQFVLLHQLYLSGVEDRCRGLFQDQKKFARAAFSNLEAIWVCFGHPAKNRPFVVDALAAQVHFNRRSAQPFMAIVETRSTSFGRTP